MGLTDRVRFVRRQTDAGELAPAFDVLVNPSGRMRDSMTLLAAMAAGCAIVAGNSPGTREFVTHGETGLLLRPANARSLSCAISYLLDAPNHLHAFGNRARREALRRFTVERMVAQNLDAYCRLTVPHPPAGISQRDATGATVGRL